MRTSDPIHAAAISALNNSAIAIALPHATNATSADITAQSGP